MLQTRRPRGTLRFALGRTAGLEQGDLVVTPATLATVKIVLGVNREPMIKVRPRPNEPVQQLMRRLKKLCEREGVLREMKRTAYYEKPSDRNRRNMRKAKRRFPKPGMEGGDQ